MNTKFFTVILIVLCLLFLTGCFFSSYYPTPITPESAELPLPLSTTEQEIKIPAPTPSLARPEPPTPTPNPSDYEIATEINPNQHDLEVFPSTRPFSKGDWNIDGVLFAAFESTVLQHFGNPTSIDEFEEGATGITYKIFHYPFGTLTLSDEEISQSLPSDFRLVGASVTLPGSHYPGPRGIKIGDSFDSVLSNFARGTEKACSDKTIYYRHNHDRKNWLTVPPSGELNYWSGKTLLFKACNTDIYDAYSNIAEIESDEIYLIKYTFSMRFEENSNVVKEYHLGYGADAE